MAEVTGMTASRALAMEAATIVDGHIDTFGHLILTRHDGVEIDAGYSLVAVPDASTTVKGISELATQAETEAHSDATRTVTPAGLASTISRITALEVIPGGKVQTITTPAESDLSTTYPIGVSIMTVVSTDGWSINGSGGTVLTINLNNNRCSQTFYSTAGGTQYTKTWIRTTHTTNGGGGWTPWGRLANPNDATTMGITGEIKVWSTNTAPSGWLICDGSAVSRTTFADLFAVIGTTYGVGNGSTTFNVPNTKGRAIVGRDSGQTEFDTIGETGGAKTHTLTSGEMPSHTHTQDPHTHVMQGTGALTDGSVGTSYVVPSGSFYGFRTDQPDSTTATNQTTGGGGAHNNLQPYIVFNHIIKT